VVSFQSFHLYYFRDVEVSTAFMEIVEIANLKWLEGAALMTTRGGLKSGNSFGLDTLYKVIAEEDRMQIS